MYSKLSLYLGALVISCMPIAASAALTNLSDIDSAFNFVFTIINSYLIPLIIALAGLYFMFGLLKYVAGGDKGKDEAKSIMIWGILILVVMLSFWGIVRIIQDTVFGDDESGINIDAGDIPNFPTNN